MAAASIADLPFRKAQPGPPFNFLLAGNSIGNIEIYKVSKTVDIHRWPPEIAVGKVLRRATPQRGELEVTLGIACAL